MLLDQCVSSCHSPLPPTHHTTYDGGGNDGGDGDEGGDGGGDRISTPTQKGEDSPPPPWASTASLASIVQLPSSCQAPAYLAACPN